MARLDLNKKVGFVLHDVARQWRWRFERNAKGEGLTRSQWSVLAQIKHKSGLRQNALAEILEIQPITLGRFIDKMEAAGWVERRDDPSDRRAKRLYLTRKAQPALDRMAKIGLKTRNEALEGFSAREEAQLLGLLLRIRGNLGRKIGGE